nr:immunoglobulin heavy chain junction region [Macaca mulatta]MOW87266.1 immunoglobulin heavy chain junction region [Macaca mulatta]MOW87651.1 immunoglobulin heavy chain junction region [Macaca mulatta]MOW88071.1 immunoglobulin heavy chain junction region [Macaca mulatta]MOW88408.1 immunoglobulin heavy chain junction region [Macaca mulatta]
CARKWWGYGLDSW